MPTAPARVAPAMDHAEFAELFPALGEAVPGEADSGGPSHVFDPEGEFWLGRQLTLPPGTLGRLAMSAAEVTALRFPERAIPQLLDAKRQLDGAEDERSAVRALLLAGLATARCLGRPETAAVWLRTEDTLPAIEGVGVPGWRWRQRADAITAYLRRRPAPAGLAAVAGDQAAGDLADVARALFSGPEDIFARWALTAARSAPSPRRGVVILALIGATSVGVGGAITVVVTLLILARIAARWLPYRVVKARTIRVTQPVEGLVAAKPSRHGACATRRDSGSP